MRSRRSLAGANPEPGTSARSCPRRPLYEKTLTFAYLARHTDEIKDFVDYSNVHWHKIRVEGAEGIALPR
jgi:hypothetical protein